MTKQELRAIVRDAKKQQTPEMLAQMSAKCCQEIAELPEFKAAECVLMYYPLPDEVDVRPLIEMAHSQHKKIILPVVCGSSLVLKAYQPGCLCKGAFGIMEPVGEVFSDYASIDWALVPGMAFDPSGHRLGRGKGYYDRLLPRLCNAWKVGVCFRFQYMENIPSLNHDVMMDEIVAR